MYRFYCYVINLNFLSSNGGFYQLVISNYSVVDRTKDLLKTEDERTYRYTNISNVMILTLNFHQTLVLDLFYIAPHKHLKPHKKLKRK